MKSTNKRLVIIAGAAGEIGSSFAKTISDRGGEIIAIVRNKHMALSSPLMREVICELESERDIETKFASIPLEAYGEIIFLHAIGSDHFDPRGYPETKPMDTIEPIIYRTNVNSFKYLMRYLVKRIRTSNTQTTKRTHLKIAMIGGVADKHAPFVIEPFCEAKFIIRQYIQSQVTLYPAWASGLSINITSTITKSALSVRPHADTQYWLTPQEVSDQSIDTLLAKQTGYKEIDLIKELPNFVQGYYENDAMLYEKWSRESGIK